MSVACDIHGQDEAGKRYLLPTTDGPTDKVCVECLFHSKADRNLAEVLLDLASRVERLERAAALEEGDAEPSNGEENKAEPEPEPEDRVHEAAKMAAAPVKRGRKAPRPRKAVD